MRVDEVIRSAIDRAGVVRVRNAMNPMLWLSSATAIVFLCAAYVFREDPILKYGLAALGALPVLASVAAYFVFLFRDPDRLQSEEFVIRQRELSIIERKGLPPVPVDGQETEEEAESIEATKAIPRGQKP